MLVCCQAGCETKVVVECAGLKMRDLFKKNWNKEKKEETFSENGKTYTVEQIKSWPWTEKVYLYPNEENLPYMLA